MKNMYLVGAVVLFIVLAIPFFQNIAVQPMLQFYRSMVPLTKIYWVFLLLGMIEWALIMMFILAFIEETKENTRKNKFELQ